MNTENFTVDDRTEDEKVKYLAAAFPDGSVAVFLLAFFVEAVNLGDLAGFVIAAHEGDTVGIADFEAEKEGEGFETEVATVDEVAKEDVVLVAWNAGVAFFVYSETGTISTGHFTATLLFFFFNIFVAQEVAGCVIAAVFGRTLLKSLFEFGIGDFRGWLNVVGGDDIGWGGGGFSLLI